MQQAAGVRLDPVSEESQVTDVLQKVTSGQADAGLVYVTDVIGARGGVSGVSFPEAAAAVNVCPSGSAPSGDLDLARRFRRLSSCRRAAILSAAGFGSPECLHRTAMLRRFVLG